MTKLLSYLEFDDIGKEMSLYEKRHIQGPDKVWTGVPIWVECLGIKILDEIRLCRLRVKLGHFLQNGKNELSYFLSDDEKEICVSINTRYITIKRHNTVLKRVSVKNFNEVVDFIKDYFNADSCRLKRIEDIFKENKEKVPTV